MRTLRFADLQSRPTPDILSTRNYPDVGLLLHASRCVSICNMADVEDAFGMTSSLHGRTSS
jgi:hypothetical protein